MAQLITEILEEINKDTKAIEKYKDNGLIKTIFEHAFDPEKKFILPDGIPPFKEDPAPIGMSPGNLLMEIRRLYIFCRADLPTIRRETLFIQLLENIHPSEAKVVLAIKDQNLPSLYKNITHKLVYEAGLITTPPVVKTTKKSKVPVGAEG